MNEKIKGVIAYLFGWLGGIIVLFGMKDNTKLTKFHACQSITLSVISVIVGVVLGFIPVVKYFGSLISLLIFVLQVIGMVKSYHEEDFQIPVISDLTKDIFKKQLDEE